MNKNPKVSIVVPIHDMKDGDKFLWRLVNSLTSQTFKDWELIITKDGRMAENTNTGIKRARGQYIKILYLDDYFSKPTALEEIIESVDGYTWLMCGTSDNSVPEWTRDLEKGNNKLGSPSALIFKNQYEDNILFDENLSWLLDCDFYKRLQTQKGYLPIMIGGDYITIGKGDHQMTRILTNEEKAAEHNYMKQKYDVK